MLLGGFFVLVFLSLRVVALMDFVARWAFSYVPLWGHPTLANPDLATLVATRKCGLGGLHFLRPAGGELCMWWSLWCLKFKSLGFARAWFMELQQGPGLAGVYLTQTAQKILPGGYAHSQLPPHVTPAAGLVRTSQSDFRWYP